MSDDLANQGRSVGRDLNNGFPVTVERCHIIEQMADRIEELESKLSLRTNLHEECIYLLKSTEAKLEKAVEGERERCAKIADKCQRENGPLSKKGFNEQYRRGLEAAGQAIAAAIRAELTGGKDE